MSKPIGIQATVVAAAAFVPCWSSGFWFAKVDTSASMLSVLSARFWIVVALLALVVVARHHRRPSAAELREQVLVGLLSQAGYVLPVYAAVALGIGSGTTALVDGIQPVVVAVLAGPLLGLTVLRVQWLGLAVAAAGVAGLVLLDASGGAAPPVTYLLLLVAVASLVAGTFVDRRSTSDLSVATRFAVHSATSALLFTALALFTGAPAFPGDGRSWVVVVGLALVPTLGGYGLYWYLLRTIDVTALNALLFLVVPTTTVGGALMFGEPMGPAVLLGIAATGAGVALVLAAPRLRSTPEEATDRTSVGASTWSR